MATVAGVDVHDKDRWKKKRREGKAKLSARRQTQEGAAKRVWKLSARLSDVEALKSKREGGLELTDEERLKVQREHVLRDSLHRAHESFADSRRGWAAPYDKPYRPLGESNWMDGAGVWQSRMGPQKRDRYPVDILDDGRRQRDQAAANVQAQLLVSKLTKSKTQKPVEMGLSSPSQVPLPPPVAELKQQLAYGDMRLRACRAGMDVVSHMVDEGDPTPLTPRISGTPRTARELYRGGAEAQTSGFPESWSQGQHSFFSSRSMASTARTWGSTTAEMRTSATIRRKSRKAVPGQNDKNASFLFPPNTPKPPTTPRANASRGRARAKARGRGGGAAVPGGVGGVGGGGAAPGAPAEQSVMRDLATMAEHTFLEPSQQLQSNCTAFREKQQEMDERFMTALAQLEQHRSENYRSKLKASLLMKDHKLTAKQPLQHELKFMGLMAQRDRTVRRLDALRSATWLGPMAQIATQHPQPRALNTPETYVLDLLKTKVNEGTLLDAEALFEVFDMLEKDEIKDLHVLQIMEYARVKVGVPFEDFKAYLEAAGIEWDEDGRGVTKWLAELEENRQERLAREQASLTDSPTSSPTKMMEKVGVTAPSPQRSVATRISLQLSRQVRILSLRLKIAVCFHRRRQRKQGPFHKPNPLDALFEKDIGKRCSVRSLVLFLDCEPDHVGCWRRLEGCFLREARGHRSLSSALEI